ncbi:translocation/assembly module TamB domain-containing protein [Lysobacter sp. A421]
MAGILRRRIDPDLTAEQREQRIAELRARRKARTRYLAVRGGLSAALVVVALGVFGYWLLGSIGGREFLLGQVVSRLPDNATLSWSKAEGPASGPLTMHDVRFTYDAIVFTAQRVTVDPALRPLLGRRLRLDAMQIENATLDLPQGDEPFELPRWPDSLPQIAPPLALQADDIQVDGFRVSSEGVPTIDIQRLRGGLDAGPGTLHIEHLVVDSDRGRFTAHGDYVPADRYRSDLVATAILPAATGRTPARLGFVAKGDLDRMDVALAGRAPEAFQATLVLRGDGSEPQLVTGAGEVVSGPAMTATEGPRWQLRANAEALDIGLLTGSDVAPSPTPLAFQFQADGVGGDARLRGELRQGDFQARVVNSRLHVQDQVLQLNPLRLQLLGGAVTARGRADFNNPDNPEFRFATNVRDLQWGGSNSATTSSATVADNPVIHADADLGLAGTMKAWALVGTATLSRAGEQAALTLDGRGDAQQMQLQRLDVQMPTGTLATTGTVAWAPGLAWDLDAKLAGFDPGYFAAGWDGAVNGHITSDGLTRDDGGLDINAELADLGGRLRGRPLDGEGSFTMHGAAPTGGNASYEGELTLALGGSRIEAQGRAGDTLDINARFSPLRLADLLPDSAGSLSGEIHLVGSPTAPDISADLDGNGIVFGDYSAGSIRIDGHLPWSRGNGSLSVRASDLVAGIELDTLAIDARGAVEQLALDANTSGALGSLAVAAKLDRQGRRWQGVLETLRLELQRGADWHLLQPAAFAWSPDPAGTGSLDNACLASSAGGSACVAVDWPRPGISITGQGLPLALVQPYLPQREEDRPWVMRGEIAIDAQLRPVGDYWEGKMRVSSASGGIKASPRARSELIEYDNLSLTADFRRQGIEAVLASGFNDDGRIDAHVITGWDAYSPLAGQVSLDTDELTWLELFVADIVEPTGQLNADIRLGGTRAEPQLGGQAQLTDFSTEIPALAITLREGNLQLNALSDGTAQIHGSVRSASTAGNPGSGVLNIDGSLGWQGDQTPLVLTVRGTDVLVSDSLELRLVASPDLKLQYQAGQPLQLSGRVEVPEARINLEQLDQTVAVSDDVVVLDPVDPEDGPGTPLQMELVIRLGDDVQMNGFGLDGKLGGGMRIVSRPGREMTATGIITVAGEYTAYGQDLRITSSQLSWSNDPIADPAIRLRAERKIGDVTAGVDVSGRASDPQAEVWSNPASSQAESLAYLTLGRPLSTLSGSERGQLNAASAALTAGGSLLASQLGAKIGLDEAGVMQSQALGGSVFGVGKQLSPRLYVGYGVSLLGTGQVLTLKYLLDHGFDIEIESSSIENRGSVNWRKEK